MAARKGEQTMSELAQLYDLHANQIKQWKDRLTEGIAGVFEDNPKDKEPEIDVKTLHSKIGQLTLENDFLSGALGKPVCWWAQRNDGSTAQFEPHAPAPPAGN